jgi:hypothetical protein
MNPFRFHSVAPVLAAWLAALTFTAPASAASYLTMGFDRLSDFEFDPTKVTATSDAGVIAAGDELIPPTIRRLDGQKVAISGFMLPMKTEDGVVTELLLMRTQMACCFGGTPKTNEWVIVRSSKKNGIKSLMDTVVTISGTLKVGTIMEGGMISGIYSLEADQMTR